MPNGAATPADPAQQTLVEFLRSRPWPMGLFRRSVDTLMLAERFETARDVRSAAARIYPASAWVQAQSTKIAATIASNAIANAPAIVVPVRQFGKNIFVQRLDEAVQARR